MSEEQEQDTRACDFVFVGRRLNGTTVVAAIRLVLSTGQLAPESLYDLKAFKGYVLGGLYRGAKFSGSQVRGLNLAKFVSRWPDGGAQIDWRARDEQAEEQQRTDKLIRDAKKVHEIEAIMLPLRRLYEGYRKRGDSAGREALEQAVLRSLRVTPRASE